MEQTYFRKGFGLKDAIAQITGVPDGTVKSRIHRARAQLKAAVEQALGEKIS